MNPLLRSLLDRGGGLVTLDGAQRVGLVRQLDWARRAGQLRRLLPGVYTRAGGSQPGFDLLRRAALLWADGQGALSHLTSLDLWGLRRQVAGERVHLSVPLGTGLRSRDGLVVHQRGGFAALPPRVLIRGGLPVTRIEVCLVESWPCLPPVDRPAAVIRAVNDRMTSLSGSAQPSTGFRG